MKNRLFLLVFTFIANISFAQIGINTTGASADASALLDVSSTSKGMLIPRMTTIQRTGIGTPAKGLMVFDNETNSFWYHNGSTWINMAAGSGFSLPYTANVNLASPLFDMVNNGNGDIFYISSMGAGTGLNSFSVGGHSINTNSVNGYGLRATSVNNYPIVGLSDNANNTLAAIRGFNIGGGMGVHGSSTADNGVFGTSSAPSKSGLRGEATGNGGNGVYGTTSSSTGVGVSGNNSAGGDGVLGASTTGYGIRGVTNSSTGFAGVHGTNTGTAGSGVVGISNTSNTQGVYGTSTNGIGVRAFSDNYRAISGTTTSGTALYGSSTSGYALETVGKVKISGGNTNPSDGAVLTSDAIGNAVWKSDRVAFKVGGIHFDYSDIPSISEWKVMLSEKLYDYGNNFEPYTGGAPGLNSSTFIAPATGIYHFDANFELQTSFGTDLNEAYFILRKQQGNTIIDLAKKRGTAIYDPGAFGLNVTDFAQMDLSVDVKLVAGEKIWLIVYQDSDLNSPASFRGDGSPIKFHSYFSGHLVFAE